MAKGNTNKAAEQTTAGAAAKPIQARVLKAKVVAGVSRSQRLGLNEGEASRVIGRFAGLVTGYKMVDSDFGDEQAPCFSGKFGALTPKGVRFASSKMFLPEPAQSEILSALQYQESTGETLMVEFAIDVEIVAAKDSPTGYEYVTTSAIPDGDAHLIDKLLSGQSVKALPAAPAQKQLTNAA